MKKLFTLLLALVLTVACILSGCSKSAVSDKDNLPVQITQNGNSMVITIDSNPTSGYQYVCELSNDKTVSVSDEYVPSSTRTQSVGFGGQQVFTVSPLQNGDVTLNLNLTHMGDNSVALTDTYDLTVSGGSVNLANHYQTFTLSLSSNSSTGNSWTLEMDRNDVLKLIDTRFVEGDPDATESPDAQEFVLRSIGDGVVVITATYANTSGHDENAVVTRYAYEVKNGTIQATSVPNTASTNG